MRRVAVVAALIVGVGVGTADAQQPATPPHVSGAPARAPEVERARLAAAALTAELRSRLMKEMAAGGALQAVKVCSEVAQQIAREHSRDGLQARRVSDRWRNPADRPDAYEAEKLRVLAAAHARGALPEETYEWVGSGGWRVLRYLKPIVISGTCLACHGDPGAMDPAALALIRERYPDDTAVGYRDGELRGAVSVVVAAPD